SGAPHDIDWILSPTDLPGGGCVGVVGTQFGPCLQETHCEGTIVAEAAWDLVHRDLMGFQGSPFNLDLNTALEIGTRLSYLGSSNVGEWYQCTPVVGGDGCNADGGYLNFLAVDDDNGNLADGTPHMSAIFAAFDRHQLACATPAVINSGCAGGPATAPANFLATPLDKGVHLTWDAVPGASEYWIYRTEGVKGCDFGKAKVGETTATEFVETGLRNGFEVLYSVVAVGANDACTSPMSACQAVTPQAGPGLGLDPIPLQWQELAGGDGDGFLDNCEVGNLAFQVTNSGSGGLTNVRLVDVAIPSHPEVEVLTELPATLAGSLAECGIVEGEILIGGGGLGFDETLEIALTVTSDELDPVTVTRSYTLGGLESDLAFHAERRFTFESDLEGWELVQGTFNRTDLGGGGDGTAFYVASSSLADSQCDQIRSPLLQLTATSTLEVFNQFAIEPESDAFFDRANVGLFDPQSGSRSVVSPDGGRLYNASGPNGACVTAGLPGWAGAGPGWLASTWTADALGSAAVADELVRLDVAYGTDPLISGIGFWFDEVTVSNVFVQGADGQSDVCPVPDFVPTGLAVDMANNRVFEAGETVAVAPSWRNVSDLSGSLTGSGEAFSGPGDSVYTIVDGDADYGAVDAGAEASCTATGDCYSLSLSVPSTRPARHWDATFDELASTGLAKAWTLHIGDSFADVPDTNIFYRFVETIFHHRVTAGCSATDYCSAAGTARAQMPVFVLKALEGPGYEPSACQTGTETFSDVPAASPFCRWIEELAARNVVAGCGGGQYCPDNTVSRDQMAVFTLKTLEGGGFQPPACVSGSEMFGDVPASSLFCPWIEELARRGVVAGCGGGNYCPAEPVARDQMAVFISKTFGLVLYGP
ncbi:MAG: S-layer homology domain-containing protein, partial [Thermoanaerobaculia bacterium]